MLPSTYIEFLRSIESAYPVEQWKVGSTRVWPVIRILLGRTAGVAAAAGPDKAPGPEVSPKGRTGSAIDFCFQSARRWIAGARDRSHQAKIGPRDVLLLSDAVSSVPILDFWYDRFCEPIMEVAGKQGYSSLLLHPSHSYRIPRHSPSFFVQSPLEFQLMKAALRTRTPELEAEAYPEFLAEVSNSGLDTGTIEPGAIAAEARRIGAAADYFERMIAGVRPRLCFVVDYYNATGMGFVLAGHRTGVPVIDLQHGGQGPFHEAYASWTRLPAEGYELLPDIFWTWSENDAVTIKNWSDSTSRHDAIAGGNVWLVKWVDPTDELVAAHDEIVARKLSLGKGVHVLITLSPGRGEPRHLRSIFEARKLAPQGWRWWIRLHPSTSDSEANRVVRLLADQGWNMDEVDAITRLPLPALLRHTDVHVTYASSACFDAAQFGVPSVVTSEEGRDAVALEATPRSENLPPFVTMAGDHNSIVEAIQRLIELETLECHQTADAATVFRGLMTRVR